uniref:RYDR_ITPR domain-containing protein n=1 Tax=Macrostomum lignano TaxID=282301 RepID=A0A1I8F6Y5_9PLAT
QRLQAECPSTSKPVRAEPPLSRSWPTTLAEEHAQPVGPRPHRPGWTWGIEEDPDSAQAGLPSWCRSSTWTRPFQAVKSGPARPRHPDYSGLRYDIERSSSSERKWYFEFEVSCPRGNIRVWISCRPTRAPRAFWWRDSIGSYAFRLLLGQEVARGVPTGSASGATRATSWGCLIDLDDGHRICEGAGVSHATPQRFSRFSRELSMITAAPNSLRLLPERAADDGQRGPGDRPSRAIQLLVNAKTGYVPPSPWASAGQRQADLGQDVRASSTSTCCGLQEGFEPFCVNMHLGAARCGTTAWSTSFETISEESSHSHILAQRLGRSATGPLMQHQHQVRGRSASGGHTTLIQIRPPGRARALRPEVASGQACAARAATSSSPAAASPSAAPRVDNFRKRSWHPRLQQRGARRRRGWRPRPPWMSASLKWGQPPADGAAPAIDPPRPPPRSPIPARRAAREKDEAIANFFKKQKSHGGAGTTCRRAPVDGHPDARRQRRRRSCSANSAAKTRPPANTRFLFLCQSAQQLGELLLALWLMASCGVALRKLERIGGLLTCGRAGPVQPPASPHLIEQAKERGGRVGSGCGLLSARAPGRSHGLLANPWTGDLDWETGPAKFPHNGFTRESVRENAVAEYIDEYHYSVRLLPGQDPACSWVGWLTPYFKLPTHDVRVCLCQLGRWTSNARCNMVNAGDLLAKFGSQGGRVQARLSQGLTIGCFLDAAGGSLSFEMNGPNRLRLGCRKRASCTPQWPSKRAAARWLALSSADAPHSAGGVRDAAPAKTGRCRSCPTGCRRSACPASAGRGAAVAAPVEHPQAVDLRGWSLLCEEPVQMFHKGTLQLYKAICSHGNRTAAEMLTNHVSADQFNFLTLNLYLSGPLRMAYFDLLIAMHLESYVKLRSLTKNEFVVPLTNDQVFSPGIDEDKFLHDFHEIPGEEGGKCIRTNFSFPGQRGRGAPAGAGAGLKDDCIQLFINAAALGGHLRDPVGGSYEYQFVPLLKVINNLLAMGCLSVEEIFRILSAVHPRTFPPELQADRHGDEAVLDFSLSDSTKTQLCKLFHLLCDTQLQHRLETLIAAAKYFVTEAQSPWPPDEPASSAARRRSRCGRWVHYNRAEYGTFLHCTSRASLKEFLQHYHSTLLSCCGVEPEEEEAATEARAGKVDEAAGGDAAQSGDSGGGGMLNQLLIKMGRRQAQDLSSLADTPAGPQNLQELICQTIIKWANSETIENLRLLREMFSLLHRQYNALGEIVDALNRAYVINSSSKADVSKLLQALGKVRCLIGVQVSPAEEEMLKASLWDIMNNTVFFQHPDLIRCLSVHETVMQLMVHTLNKSKLAMEVTPAGAAPEEGGSSENMIVMCCRFLCYFCRTGVQNQRAVFEHLSF